MADNKESFLKSTFFIRTVSGIVLVAIALLFIITGGDFLLAGLGIISLIGVFELYRVVEIEKKSAGIAGYIVTLIYYICLYKWPDNMNILVMIFMLSIIVFLAVYVLTFPKYKSSQIMTGYFGVFYVAVMLSYIFRCRMLDGGVYLVWLTFLCSWGCDTCAYLAGITFGKHKMAPVLSPKKSIEGAVGGVIGAMLLSALFAFIFKEQLPFSNAPLICAVVCGIGSLISMIGDLAASAIKRDYNIKDYGTLIPGHGGILDRFDSVIFTAPIIYYTITLFL